MFLKDHLIDTYQKASLEKNSLIVENVINRWAHRFGIETITELVVKDQDQINLENVKHQREADFKSIEEKSTNITEILDEDIYESFENKYNEKEELPLPNINNLRKWIKNEKKAS